MPLRPASDEVSTRLRRGPLGRGGGFTVCTDLPGAGTLRRLRVEARESYALATRQVSLARDPSNSRGGIPARALTNGPGGAVQDRLYGSASLQAFLSRLCGTGIRPTGARGSYSYYTEPGDFLDTHRDVHRCDVTLITVLHDDTPPDDPGGGLAIFPDCTDVPLATVHALDDGAAFRCKVRAGDSVVLLGGLVPHRVMALGGSGQRVISALCFEAT